jgi:redox-sensing transcriptional repressor
MANRDRRLVLTSAPIRLAGRRRAAARLQTRPLERLMRYYQYVSEQHAPVDCENTPRRPTLHVTSGQIAKALDVDPTQVRKDFGAIGLVGLGRVGYDVCEVCRTIRALLRFDNRYEAVVIGAGHLGGALAAYGGFATYGLRIVAVFDNDKRKIGATVGGMVVKPIGLLGSYIGRHQIPVAIITAPAGEAQRLADRAVAAGVNAIWNFSPTQVAVPPRVLLRHEHISLGLAVLAHRLKR